ncbi:MAG TPA: toxin-antitoxin system HicB family antitoxin [Bradyrhizobium sp.]|nr:toxin-antitoxin system HicB family antitoxin [Bradyrhizobium sp.]
MAKVTKARGRPAVAPEQRKSKNFTFRGTGDLHERLRLAAQKSHGSVSEEIEARLLESFDTAQKVDTVFENRTLYGIMRLVATAMNSAGETAGGHSRASHNSEHGPENWHNDPHGFDQAVKAANRIFEALRPQGEIKPPKFGKARRGDDSLLDLEEFAVNLGQGFANGLLYEIASDEPTTGAAVKRAPEFRRDLGPAIVERIKAFVGGAS